MDNDFVSVTFNASTNTINCTFLTGMSASEKHCSVVYGPCSQTPTQSVEGSVNGSTNSILLILRFNLQSDYCYTVSASNDDFAVQVEGIVKIGIIFKHFNIVCYRSLKSMMIIIG